MVNYCSMYFLVNVIMNIIFLDIDGVMNSRRNAIRLSDQGKPDPIMRQFDPEAIQCLNRILEETDAQIVISSIWRLHWSLDPLRHHFRRQGVSNPGRIIDETPKVWSRHRGREIELWLKDHECDQFVIIDDGSNLEPFMDHLVKTEFDNGMTTTEAEEVIRRFNTA